MQFTSDRKMIYYISLMGFFAIFSTTISKNPVLPLFSQAYWGKRYSNRVDCGFLATCGHLVLVSDWYLFQII